LLAQENVKDYSTLNPGTELTESRVLTCKGFKGSNVQEAYNLKRRSYPNSMLGVSAISTPSDGNVGVTKHMALEPTVTNVRGYCDLKYQDPDSLKDVNLLSPDELMYPIAGSHDDPTRICMASKQTNHIVPTTKMQSALICNGMEEAVRFNLSTDYVVNAKMDGKVIEVDDKNKMIVVEYKDGTHQVLDLSSNIVKNGGGGFFMNNKKISNLKVGDKFKKNDLLAWHEGFFTNDEINGPRLKIGSLQKVAITTSYATYEDSTFITDKLAHDCATSMTFRKDIVIGKNSNLEYIIKVGDHVEVGDTLLQFDTSYEDSELNKLLKNIGEDLQEEVLENSKNNVKSKYAGEVVDIKIYSPVPLEELSPSLQKLVGNYYKGNKSKYNKIKSYATDEEKKSVYACGVLMTDPVDKVEPNRFGVIRGEKVGTDNIKIEVYIEHGDVMGVGDKLAYFAALKGTIGEVIPKGLEPYTTTRPDEQVSATIASNSILKRMVPSIILNVLGNKVLVELKRKLKEIYES
jgi:DNA-directed RNA polymerase beta subunit